MMDVEVDRRLQQLEARLENEEVRPTVSAALVPPPWHPLTPRLAMLQGQRMALESELKDQQEAMDALMDMLEKTITVEVPRRFLPSPGNCVSPLAQALAHTPPVRSAGHARPSSRAGNAAWAAAEHS